MRIIISMFVLLLSYLDVIAQINQIDFPSCFADSTLRIDYIFSGNSESQSISLDKMSLIPHWYGKKANLSNIPVEGNGQIIVQKHATKEIIYKNSFSTLFQEWLTYDESKKISRAFENVFLIPMPKDTVDVTINLFDNRHCVIASFTHIIIPTDVLIRRVGFNDVTPYITLQKASDTSHCIHIAFVAEGYTKEEMSLFIEDAKKATEALFCHEPFKSMRKRFNVIAVESSSKESGTSEPSNGIWKNTILGSHFDTFYSERYLTTLNLKDLHDILAGTPYEHIIVLVNTSQYGGGGILNSYNLSMAHHVAFEKVVVHEFGHSFAGLADEYAYEEEQLSMYPMDIEPWEPNITTMVNFHGKWEDKIKKSTPIPTPITGNNKRVGLYEGAGYSLHGVYRGHENCRMRSNNIEDFCSVCQDALTKLIKFYTE